MPLLYQSSILPHLKYRHSIFRVPNLDKWMVIVRGPEYIEEIKKAPETQLSFVDEAEEVSDDCSYIRQYSNPL